MVSDQNELILELDKDYHILSLSDAELHDSVLLVLKDDNNVTTYSACNCGSKLSNCQMKAVSKLVIANIGCVAADVTVILGLICHAAATSYGGTLLNGCEFDYQDCKRKCS